MHAEILTKQQYEKWDAFAYTHPYSSIHQTSRWAHFQSNVAARDKFWIIGIFNDKEEASKSQKNGRNIIAGTVLIRHKMPKGYTWLYAPRGPLLSYDEPALAHKQMQILLAKVKEIAKGEKTIFFRIDPLIEIQNGFRKPLIDPKSLHVQTDLVQNAPKTKLHFPHFHFSHLGYQPEDTLILDITPTEEAILAQMKEKGRYNIRLASKKNLKIVEVKASSPESTKQIKAYFDILQETLERDKFHGHGISFYKNMVEKLAMKASKAQKQPQNQGFSQMLLAYHNDTPIAGIIATFYKDTGMYYFGASSNAHRNLMAPYLLQWHAILLAKKHNLTKYDFLGIAPITEYEPLGPKTHHWRGVTEFKTKFGGTHVKYLPPQDFAFRPLLYRAYTLAKRLRKILH